MKTYITGTEAEAHLSKRAWFQPELAKFLKEKGLYKEAVRYVKAWRRGKKWNYSLFFAFPWVKTDEGYVVWENLYNEFNSRH